MNKMYYLYIRTRDSEDGPPWGFFVYLDENEKDQIIEGIFGDIQESKIVISMLFCLIINNFMQVIHMQSKGKEKGE